MIQITLSAILLLRLVFWVLFPQFGRGLNSELIFAAISIMIVACGTSTKTPVRFPVLFLILSTIVSIFIAHDKTKATAFMLSQGAYIIMFSMICNAKKNDLLFVFMVALTLISGKSIYEIPFIERTHSFIGWPTATASVLLLGIPIALKMKRPVISTILIVGLLATKSIMPIVSLMIIIGIMYYKRWYVLLCGALAVSVIVVFRGGIVSTLDVRMEYLDEVIRQITNHPLTGSGVGSFILSGANQTIYAHNSYLQIWAETGIIGFLAICALVYKIVQEKPITPLQQGVYFGLLAFLIDNVTNFTLLRYSTSIYFWFLLGIYFNMRRSK